MLITYGVNGLNIIIIITYTLVLFMHVCEIVALFSMKYK